MKNHLFLLLLTISFLFSDAQTLTGKVFDSETNEPIVGVHVYTKNQEEVTLTNRNGKFRLKIGKHKSKRDTLYFSHVEYKIAHVLISEIDKNFELSLQKQVNSLDEVSVLSNKQKKSFLKFKTLSPMKKGLFAFDSELINNKIYIVGGQETDEIDGVRSIIEENQIYQVSGGLSLEEMIRRNKELPVKRKLNSDILVYDLTFDKWTEKKQKTKERIGHSINYNSATNKLYILGGRYLSPNKYFEYLDNEIEVYDVEKDSIVIDKTNPHKAVNFASFMYQDNLILLGGSTKINKNGIIEFSDKIHTYNTKTGYWYEVGKLKKGKELEGILIGDEIYIFGGNRYNPIPEVEKFSLKTGKWQLIGKLFEKFKNPATASHENTIFLFEDGKLATYNIKQKELRQYNIGLHLNNSKMHFADDKLFIVGGSKEEDYSTYVSNGVYSVDIDEFDTTKVKVYQKF